MDNLQKARSLLESGNYTCVVCKEDSVYTTTQRGVAPLLNWLEDRVDLRDFSAADRVVGRGAAFLYCLLGVKAVSAPVVSTAAADVLNRHGIVLMADLEVDFIWNRRHTGPCPMETAVKAIEDPHLALTAIQETLQKL